MTVNILRMPGERHNATKKMPKEAEQVEKPVHRYEWTCPKTGRIRIRFSNNPIMPSMRSDLAAPSVHGDNIAYQSMIDGTMITDRAQHRQHLLDNDVEEVGNESTDTSPPPVNERAEMDSLMGDIKTGYEQAEAGYIPPTGPVNNHDSETERLLDQITPETQNGDLLRAA